MKNALVPTGAEAEAELCFPSCRLRLEQVVRIRKKVVWGFLQEGSLFVPRAYSVPCTVGLCFLPHPSEALVVEGNAGCPWFAVGVKLRFFTSRRLRCILLFGGCRWRQVLERSDHASKCVHFEAEGVWVNGRLFGFWRFLFGWLVFMVSVQFYLNISHAGFCSAGQTLSRAD